MQEGRPGLPSLEPRSEPCPTPEEVAGCPGPGASARGPQSARSSSAAMAAQARTVWGSDVPGFVFLLSCVFSVPPTAAAVWTPPVRLLGSPLRRTYLLDGLISPSSLLARVCCLVCLSVCPCPRGLACRGARMGLGARAGCAAPAPAPAPAGAPPTLLSRLQGFCPGRKGAQARTPEPPGSLVPVQPRGPRQTSLLPISVCPKGPSSAQVASGCEATGRWQAQAGAVGAQPGGGLCGDAPRG